MEKTPGISFPIKGQSKLAQSFNTPNALYFTHNYDIENNVPEGNEMYGVKDYVSVAVWTGDKPVAVICADHLLTKLPITDTQLEALRLFAGYAGLAIENARLNTILQNELAQRKETLIHQSAILNGIPDMAWLKDKNSRYVAVNEQFAQTAGMTMEEIVGKTDFEIWQEGFAQKYRDDDIEVMQSGQRKHHIEELQMDRTGREYWVETTKTPILNEQNEAIGTTGIAHEITKRKKAELERETLITELETKNAELERYTYTVSHDLKSPLVTIRGFLGYLERDALAGNTQKVKDDVIRIEHATEKMQTLLNDLLELSRIGRLMNQPTDVLFTDIVKDAIALVDGQIKAKDISIKIHDTLAIVHGDRTRLTEVIQNLVDNAIKFTGSQPKPQITIGAITNELNETVFFVRDNGIGIESQYHDRIFTLFNKLNTNTEGTGIGLTLVKRIIEIHNGRIWLESEPGKGTTFYFTIPQA
jgi:PAS domain S-box-containing protein